MAKARAGKASSSNSGVAAALKEEISRALSHMPGYGEHFSDADVGIDVTNEGGDLAVYLFAREPQGFSGTSMRDAPQQWHDEMNARENAVNAVRDVLMSNPHIHDAEFDDSDEFYGTKSDFVAALNIFFDAKGLPPITNPLLLANSPAADSREESLHMPEFWTKENRPYSELCERIEEAIAESAAGDDIVSSDITAKIVQLPNGKYGLSVWSMDVGSAFDKPSDGDLRWADEQQGFIDDAPGEFLQHLHALVKDGKAKEFVRDMNEFDDFGGDDEAFVFDRLEDIEAAVNSFANNHRHPKMPATGFADKHKPSARDTKPAERDTSLENQIKSKFVAWLSKQEAASQFFTNQDDTDATMFQNRLEDAVLVSLEERNGKLSLRIDCDGWMLAGRNGFSAEVNAKMDFTDMANLFMEQLHSEICRLDPAADVKVTTCDYGYAKHLDPEDDKERIAQLKQSDPGALATDISGETIEWVSDMEQMDELVPIDDSRITAPKEQLLEAIGALSAVDPASIVLSKSSEIKGKA